MPNLAPSVIVFEKRPRREAGLKRHLATDRVVVRPCRSRADLVELCTAMPGSVAVFDLEADAATLLLCLEQALARRLDVAPVIVAPPSIGELEWPLRELGALAVVPDTTRDEELAQLCRLVLTKSTSGVAR